jgi:hypothetical protein
MAEITTLVAAIYRKYSTAIYEDFEDFSPGITSRFEVFCDETYGDVRVSSLKLAQEKYVLNAK